MDFISARSRRSYRSGKERKTYKVKKDLSGWQSVLLQGFQNLVGIGKPPTYEVLDFAGLTNQIVILEKPIYYATVDFISARSRRSYRSGKERKTYKVKKDLAGWRSVLLQGFQNLAGIGKSSNLQGFKNLAGLTQFRSILNLLT